MQNNSPLSTKIKEKKDQIPRIVIADDHELIQKIYELTLQSAGLEVVCIVSNGDRAVKAIMEHKPDIVLMDIAMPEMDGLAALSVLKYMLPEIPVLVISHMTDPLYAARAMELGAAGFLSKGISPTDLISTIKTILSGERLSDTPVQNAEPATPSVPGFAFPTGNPREPMEENFTDQEQLILSLIAIGKNNQSIMERLHISKNTLKTHSRNIYSKLGVKDRTKAAIWGVHNGYGASVLALN